MTTNNAPKISMRVSREDLVDSMARVTSILERRSTIPILSNALIVADGDKIHFTATDLDIEVTDSFASGDIEASGRITVPAQMLYDISRKLKSGADILMFADHNASRVDVKSGRSSFSLPILPPEDFPSMASVRDGVSFDISASDLKEMIDRTKIAMSTELTRYYLNGVYMHIGEGSNLIAVSTDGHRLALSKMPAPAGAEGMPGVIIPRKTILELRRLIDSMPKDSDISVMVSDAKISFKIENMLMTSKLIDGTFPDYNRVIPKQNPFKMVADGTLLRKAVDRVATISSEKARSIKFIISGDNLRLDCNSHDMGAAHEDMRVDYEGDDITIGFNSRYVADTMSQMESDSFEMYIADPASPALVLDPASEGSLFVMMPLRV